MTENIDEVQDDRVQEVAKGDDREVKGAFFSSLRRNNRQIKEDRAQAISEDEVYISRGPEADRITERGV